MMTEAEYKALWLQKVPETQTDYNAARFADDKLAYAKQWVSENVPYENEYTKLIIPQKYRMITDKTYCELCSRWSDKISVYSALNECGLNEITLPYVYMHYGEMTLDDFNGLHGSFVAKCNHGSGWNKFFNTNNVNKEFVIKEINDWQFLNYAYITGYEAQYKDIRPGVIIQPDMICNNEIHSYKHALLDYSFYCSKGEIIAIALTKKLSKIIEEHIAFVDENGKALPRVIGNARYEIADLIKSQKKTIDIMKPYVKQISSMFDFVRVDLYFINGNVYFGETTFTPSSGRVTVQERT